MSREYNGLRLDSRVVIAGAFEEFSPLFSISMLWRQGWSVHKQGRACRVSYLTQPRICHQDIHNATKKLKSNCTTGPHFLQQYMFNERLFGYPNQGS